MGRCHDNEEIRELASLFAAGALPPGEEAEFQEHEKSCRVCANEARALRVAAGWMPFAFEGADAPPHLREKLLAGIRSLTVAAQQPLRPEPPPPM